MRYSILILLAACDGGVINPAGGGGKPTDSGVAEDPNLTLSVTEVDFGDIEYGKTYQQFVSVTNRGAAELVVSTITAETPFQVNPLSVTIQPGSTTQLTVSVNATTYEEFSSNVVFASNDPDGDVSLPVHGITITDADGDGHSLVAAGGDDCDDGDRLVYPGAPEVWYDGIDENCDGLSDYDQDGDGWESDAYNADPSLGGGDCQDSNTDYYPGAADVPYDNRDTNCDGADDYDFDGDGSRSSDYGKGLDCNDNDPNVNISADEQLNGEDDDCDGEIDTSCAVSASEYVYVGKGSYDQAGYAVATGDLDDDGYAEVIVGGPYYNASSGSGSGRGIVGIFAGAATLPASPGDLRDADRTIQGDGTTDGLGNYVTVLGDFDGDGDTELSLSALSINSNGGAVYLITGTDALRGKDTGDAIFSLTGSSGQYVGRGVATAVDLDGDGLSDLAADYSSSGNAVALVYGGATGSLTPSSADANWTYSGTDEGFYRNAPVGADLDDDGYDDLLYSDGTVDSPSTDAGAVWVVWGQASRYSGSSSFSGVSTVIGSGSASSDGFGTAAQVGPDISGDGVPDIWVYEADTALYAFAGGSYLRSGQLNTASALVTYEWEGSYGAKLIRRGGDFSGDGIDDMFVGYEDTGNGAFMWMKSELLGSGYSSKSDYGGYAAGSTDNSNGYAGYGMAPLGADIDGDGDKDYVVGDPQKQDSSGNNEGEAYVLMNEHQ